MLDDHLPEVGPGLFRNVVAEAGFATLAGIAHAAQFVQGGGDVLVGILGERAMAHGCTPEMIAGQVQRGLHRFHGNRRTVRIQVEQVTQHGGHARVYHVGEVAVFRADNGTTVARKVGIFTTRIGFFRLWFGGLGVRHGQFGRHSGHGCLAQGHANFGVEGVIVAVAAEHLHVFGALQPVLGVLDQLGEIDAADAAGEIPQVFHQVGPESDGFKQQGAPVAFRRGDSHLADDFLEAVLERREHIFQAFAAGQGPFLLGVRILEGQTVADQAQHQIGMNCICSEGDQAGNVMAFLHIPGLNHQAAVFTQTLTA